MILTKEQILQTRQLPRETVSVPELGGEIIITVMTGFQRDEWEMSCAAAYRQNPAVNMRAMLVVRCAIDESGNKLFIDEDADELGKQDGVALNRLSKVAERLNKLREKDMEELKGNS